MEMDGAANSNVFRFIHGNEPRSFGRDAYVARIKAVSSESELFQELADQLALPGYFGFNWNALDECVRDFHWIPQRLIVMVHDRLAPELPEADLQTYLEVLQDAVRDWKAGEDHELRVAFDLSDRDRIEALGF
jgi:RNAse (barnase) inhibitor barstar